MNKQKIFTFLFLFLSSFIFANSSWPSFASKEIPDDRYSLIAFTGSDWCPWSKKFIEEFLSDYSISSELSKQIELFQVDFPEEGGESVLEQLKNQYHITELPMLVLLAPEGEPVAYISYLSVETSELQEHIYGLIEDSQAVFRALRDPRFHQLGIEEVSALYQKACRLEIPRVRDYLLKRGIKLDKSPNFLLEKYALLSEQKGSDKARSAVKKQILQRDPNNMYASRFRLATIDFAHGIKKLRRHENPEKALLPLLNYVRENHTKDTQHIWEAEMMMARFLYEKKMPDKALKHAHRALHVAPVEQKEHLEESIAFLESHS